MPVIDTRLVAPKYCIFHDRCPAGSACTLKVTVDVTDADENISWTVFTELWVGGPPCAPEHQSFPLCIGRTAFAACDSHPQLSPTYTPCPRSASLSAFGENDFDARCAAGYNQIQPPSPNKRLGPDASRQATCRATFRIVPAVPLGALFAGTTATVLVPSAGTLTLSAIGKRLLHGAQAARKRSGAQPPIAPVRLKATKTAPVVIPLKLSERALSTLRRHHALAITLALAFTAVGGQRTVSTERVTLMLPACVRLPRPSRKRRCPGQR
jgi:hypothetical protein